MLGPILGADLPTWCVRPSGKKYLYCTISTIADETPLKLNFENVAAAVAEEEEMALVCTSFVLSAVLTPHAGCVQFSQESQYVDLTVTDGVVDPRPLS